MKHSNSHTSDSDCSTDQQNACSGSVKSNDLTTEMTEEDQALLGNAGVSYDVDLSRVYTLELKGTLCFVGLKVHSIVGNLNASSVSILIATLLHGIVDQSIF